MSVDAKEAPLLEQQLALGAYLDALLAPAPVVAPPPELAPAHVAHIEPEPVAAPVEPPQPEPVPAATDEHAPFTADASFSCLLFKVGGLALALPLAHLNGVIPWNDAIAPMPGHAPWFLGLLDHLGRQVKVVDTAHLLLPENKRMLAGTTAPAARRIVLIDDGRWGLAVDEVNDMVTVDPAGVHWRRVAGNRPWLAGIIAERGCALLDAAALARRLLAGR